MRSALAVLVALFSVAAGAPQTGTAPAKHDPRDLSGTWNLDAWLSDPSEQNEHALQADLKTSVNPTDIYAPPTGGVVQGPGPTMGPGPMGGPMNPGMGGGRRGAKPPQREQPLLKAEDQARVRSILDIAQLPAATLTITQGEDTITIVDPLRGSRTFHVNGAKEKQTFDSGVVESTTHWEGPELHIDYDAGHGVTLRFSYLLAQPANVLLVRFNVFTSGNQGGPFAVRTVYDRQS